MITLAAKFVAMVAVVGLPTVCGCQSHHDTASLDQATTKVDYTYVGSSTAPQYHREYRIVVAGGSATISVGTYGTVDGSTPPIRTETKPVDAARWKQLTDRVDELPDHSSTATNGCTGGSTYGVTINANGKQRLATSVYACGADHDAKAKPFTDFIAPVESLFDMASLTRSN